METIVADSHPPKYPPALMDEYKGLVNKQSEDRLTVREQRRLDQIMAQINAIDRADPETQRSLRDIKETRVGLVQLRRELEALLAAPHDVGEN